MKVCFTEGIPHGGATRNAARKSRNSVKAATEIAGAPMTYSAHAGLNIHAGSPQVVSSGRRTKMYSPNRSF